MKRRVRGVSSAISLFLGGYNINVNFNVHIYVQALWYYMNHSCIRCSMFMLSYMSSSYILLWYMSRSYNPCLCNNIWGQQLIYENIIFSTTNIWKYDIFIYEVFIYSYMSCWRLIYYNINIDYMNDSYIITEYKNNFYIIA